MNAKLALKPYGSPYAHILTATVATNGDTATYTIPDGDFYGGIIRITPTPADYDNGIHPSHTIQFGADDDNGFMIGDWDIVGFADSDNLNDRTASAFNGLDNDTYRVARAIASAIVDHYDATHANA